MPFERGLAPFDGLSEAPASLTESSSSSACLRAYSTESGPNAGKGGENDLGATACLPDGIRDWSSDCGGTGWNVSCTS